MATVRIPTFYGVVPRLHPADLKPGYASVAQDVRLTHGTLDAWRERLPVLEVAPTTQTIHPWGCCWFAWDRCVEVAQWQPSCPRLYVTGEAPYPLVGVLEADCAVTWYRLGVPAPGAGPRVGGTLAVAQTQASEGRDYVFTFVNALGEEGPPSYPSNASVIEDGVPVTLTDFPVPDPEWGVTHLNIYRSATGFRTGYEDVEEPLNDFFLVATIPVGTVSYTDTLPNTALGVTLPTREVLPPPTDLRGITLIPDTQTLVGFRGNEVWFSGNAQPWNWPESNRLSLDDNIVALGAVDGYLYAATTGRPYAIEAKIGPDDRTFRAVRRHMTPLPMVTCCSNRGAVVTPFGLVYVSADGLVLLTAGEAKVITDMWYAQDDWRRLQPETMRLGYYAGVLFCASDAEAFMLTLDTNTYAAWETYKLSTLSDRPQAMVTGANGELFMLERGVVSQWNAGEQLRPYQWESHHIDARGFVGFSAGRVYADGSVYFTLSASGRRMFSRSVIGGNIFRILSCGQHIIHTVTLQGTAKVWDVTLATSVRELVSNG
jgi:hypothetical protein